MSIEGVVVVSDMDLDSSSMKFLWRLHCDRFDLTQKHEIIDNLVQ